jgi:hypothetical protein
MRADRAVRAGLDTAGLFDRAGTARLGHDVADCPRCGQMMRVDGWTFTCYAQCGQDEIGPLLERRPEFVAGVEGAT